MRRLKFTLLAAIALGFATNAAPLQACNGRGNCDHGAPGPLAGAGLPFLIAAGAAGGYWRLRRRSQESRYRSGDAAQVRDH